MTQIFQFFQYCVDCQWNSTLGCIVEEPHHYDYSRRERVSDVTPCARFMEINMED